MRVRIHWNLVKRFLIVFITVLCIRRIYYSLFHTEPSLYFNENGEIFINFHGNHYNEQRSKLTTRNGIQLKSASIHYSKTLQTQWIGLLDNALEMGLNTIHINIPWNSHQPTPEDQTFSTFSNDLITFIELVHRKGLFLLIRLDPFQRCSIYDLGGLPSWLLGVAKIQEEQKSLNENGGIFGHYENLIKKYFIKYLDSLLPILMKYQMAYYGGPIIGFTIKDYKEIGSKNQKMNNFASYNDH
jgi:beta-galactosidase GanA